MAAAAAYMYYTFATTLLPFDGVLTVPSPVIG